MSPLSVESSRYRPGRDYSATRWKNAGNDEPRALLRNDRARGILAVPFGLPIISVPRIEITKASASLRFASSARARDADEEEHEEGNGGEERVEQAPPIESTCSPAIVAISIVAIPIAACRRNAPRSDPGIPVGLASRILPRTPGYSFTSTTLARLHARRPLSTFQRGAYETFWVTRFRLSATWNEVSALSEAAPRVRSGLNIATCLRRRSRKV